MSDFKSLTDGNGNTYNVKDDVARKMLDYSTDEVSTGVKWIDGKTIYKKTIVVNNFNNIDLTSLNIDMVVKGEIMCVQNSGNIVDGLLQPTTIALYETYHQGWYYQYSTKSIVWQAGQTIDEITVTSYLTLYYTKN